MRFFLRRTAFYAFTAWAAITINFFLPRMMKGDPVSAYLQKNQGRISPEAIASLRTLFGLDSNKSLLEQYIDYWQLLFSGDLGRSFSKGLAPVTDVIASAIPWTVGLVGIATVISFVVGTSIGAALAISTQENAPVAAAPATAREALRKSRRASSSVMGCSRVLPDASLGAILHHLNAPAADHIRAERVSHH